jgi:hypothetical protein
MPVTAISLPTDSPCGIVVVTVSWFPETAIVGAAPMAAPV